MSLDGAQRADTMNPSCGASATHRVHLLQPADALQLDLTALIEGELPRPVSAPVVGW